MLNRRLYASGLNNNIQSLASVTVSHGLRNSLIIVWLDMLNPPEKTDPTQPSLDSGGLGWLSQNPRVTLGSDWPTHQAMG